MLLIVLCSLAAPLGAGAKTFKTQFVKFELPPNWSCKQEELDWVCQPDNLAERSEAIVVVVTKAANEVDDTLPKYEEVLRVRRNMRDLVGNAYQSEVKSVRTRQIKNHPWVDALQLGSEIPGFYSRYVATVKEKVAALLTYSVAESVYPKYATTLDQMIDSTEVFFDPKAFAEAMNASPTSLLGSRGIGAKLRSAPKIEGDAAKNTKKDEGTDMSQIIGGALIVGAVVFYIIKKKRG